MTLPIVPTGTRGPTPLPLPPSRRGAVMPTPAPAGVDMPPLVDAVVPAPPARDQPPLPPILAEPDAADGLSLGGPPARNWGDTFDEMQWLPPLLPPVPPLLGLGWQEHAWPMSDSAHTVLAALGAMKRARTWGELRDIADQAADVLDPHMADMLRTAAEQRSEALGITPRWDIVQGPIEMVNAIAGGLIAPLADAMQGGAFLWEGIANHSRSPELEALMPELLHVRDYDEAELEALRRRADGLGEMERFNFAHDIFDVLRGAAEPEALITPDPRNGWLFREADALRDAFTVDATPGWEDSNWRAFGTDLGGLFGGATLVAATGPWAGAGLLALGGAGQAGNRYLGWADEHGMPVDPGQLFWSSAGGLVAGGLSLLPLGRLTGKLPALRRLEAAAVPRSWGAAGAAAMNAGVQAGLGAVQAGATQAVQNWSAQQVYDDDLSTWDGVPGSLWRGGLINGVAGALPAAVEAVPWVRMDDTFGF
jgi:hypothetical protein